MNQFKKVGTMISKDEYMRVFSKIGAILRPRDAPQVIDECVQQDFERDFNAKESIDQTKLAETLFELADIWTPNIEAEEMKEFFDKLKSKMKSEVQRDQNAYNVMD